MWEDHGKDGCCNRQICLEHEAKKKKEVFVSVSTLEIFYSVKLCNLNYHTAVICIFYGKFDTQKIKYKLGMMHKYEVSDKYVYDLTY